MGEVNDVVLDNASVPENRTRGVDSARKVLQILLQFSASKPELNVEDVAAGHGMSVPSAYRYIALLRELHFVEERNRGTYVLSPQVLRLTGAAEASLDIVRAAQPVVERLVAESGETVLVLRRVGNAAVCITSSQPDLTLSMSFRPGHMMPLHRGAAAKVLLAAAPAASRHAYLDRLEPMLSSEQRDAVTRELVRISLDGFAESNAEVDDGVWAVAVPVVVESIVVASLSIAGPSFRADDEARNRFRLLAQQAGAEIGEVLARG